MTSHDSSIRPAPEPRVQVSLSAEARKQVELRTLAEQALSRRWGALIACGEVSRDGVNLLSNLGMSWSAAAIFSAEREATLENPVGHWVREHQARGYRCQALDLDTIVATLPVEPYPATIAFLHLLGIESEACLRRLEPLVTPGGVVVLEGVENREAVDRLARSMGLVAAARHHPDLACWIRPGIEQDSGEGSGEATTVAEGPVAASRGDSSRFTVLTYPDPPAGKFALLCERGGFRVTRNLSEPFNVAFKWYGETYTPNDLVLDELAAVTQVVNWGCQDISKRRVEEVHQEIFGYGLVVDPRTYRGLCVKKANLNAQCQESVVECPRVDAGEDEFVYQRMIVTPREPEEFEEYRVPITGNEIPCVVIKRRPLAQRFDRCAGYAVIADAEEVFTPAERAPILELCRAFGLDFGDLDILREQGSGRLHVIDVNPTPGGPGGAGYGYTEEQRQDLLGRQLDALRRVFVRGRDGVEVPLSSAGMNPARS